MIADKENPIRCSRLSSIARCSGRIFLVSFLDNEDDVGGEAAQTGSLTHAGVAAFHKERGNLEIRQKAAWDAIAKTRQMFPLANIDETRLFLTPYINDPRNIHAQIVQWSDGEPAIEKQVEFTLQPHRLDSTGELIYVQGTFDQIRYINGVPRIYDLKTGKKTGWEQIHDYSVQQAAYLKGASQFISNIDPTGYIIRCYGYRMKGANLPSPDGVFWCLPFKTWDAIDLLLDAVVFHVAMLRNGEVNFTPGPHCTFCEFGGLTGCLPEFDRIKLLMSVPQPIEVNE
jgi:hypothetical protein